MSNAPRHLHVFAILGVFAICLSGLCPRRAEAQKPVARFHWKMVDRFGPRKPDGSMIDFHWYPDSVLPKYDPSYVNPQYWKVEVNACQAGNGEGTFYTWTTLGPPAEQLGPSPECVDTLRFSAPGPYPVKLAVTSPSGLRDSVRDVVVVKDWLIVSIGDSYASGEGNPDIHQRFDNVAGLTVVKSGPKWEDRRCHRSEFSGPAQAALAIERADSFTSVTFLSFACSGAQIDTGLTGGYAGAGGEHAAPWLLSQVDQAASAVKERPIDVLLIQIGVNDIGFDAILSKCRGIDSYANDPMQYLNPLTAAAALLSPRPYCPDVKEVVTPFWNNVGGLPAKFSALRQQLQKLQARAVYISGYPDPTHNSSGGDCGVDSPRLLSGIDIDPGRLWSGIDTKTALWFRNTVITQLNRAISRAALVAGWRYVPDIGVEVQNRGECAPEGQRAFNTEEDARRIEGPWNPFEWTNACLQITWPCFSRGTFHPNAIGHAVYRDRILQVTRLPGGRSSFTIPDAIVDTLPGAEAGSPSAIVVHTPYKTPEGRPFAAKAQINGDSVWFDTDTPYTYTFHGSCQAVTVRAPTDLYFDTRGTVCLPLKQLLVVVPKIKADTLPLAPGVRDKKTDFIVGVYDKFNRPVAASVRIREAGRRDTVVRANTQVTGFVFTVAVVSSASPLSQRFRSLIPRFRRRPPVNQKLGTDESVDPTTVEMPELEGVTDEPSGQVTIAPSGDVIPDSPDYRPQQFVFPLHNLVGGPLKLPTNPYRNVP